MKEPTKFDAIVLKVADYKEYDRVLTIFSSSNGKQRVLLKGCKRPKAKQRFAGQPFFFGEFLLVEGKGFDVVTQVEPKKTFIELTSDYEAYLNASQVLKTIDDCVFPQMSEKPFLLLLTYLVVLKDNLSKSEILTCKFYIEFLKMQGFELNSEYCSNCDCQIKSEAYFEPFNNSIVCENCRTYDSLHIAKRVLEYIRIINTNKMLALTKMQFDEKDIKSLKNLLCDAVKRIFR